jgi:CHAT domain-containing protein/tetratricopeptide (TPR) repeat protein
MKSYAGSIADFDCDITFLQNSLSLYPRAHSEHINCVSALAVARLMRFRLSQEKEDLDQSIVHYTTAILLPVSRAGDVPRLLLSLTTALRERSEKYEQPRGIEYSIKYLRYLRRFPIDSSDVPRSLVTTSLIRALGTQVEWGAGNETQNIKEMVVLGRELLTSNLSAREVFPIAAFVSLANATNAEYRHGRPIELLDEVIECLRDAVEVCPPGSASALVPLKLVGQLRTRFITTHSLDDYEEATALLEKILDPSQPGGCQDSICGVASLLATELAVIRNTYFTNPEYSEVAISRLRATLSSSSIDEELRFHFTEVSSMLVRRRFEDYSLSENLEEANSNISQVVDLSSSQSLAKSGMFLSETNHVRGTYSTTAMQQKIQILEEMLSKTPPGTERYKKCLSGLANWYESKFCRTKDISYLKQSIKYSQLSLDATHASDLRRFKPLISLHNILFLAFKETREINYLNKSITICYDILELKTSQQYHFRIARGLVHSLCIREKFLGRGEDRLEAIRLISVFIDHQYAQIPDRFRLSCLWAILARSISHLTTLTAYKNAMSLMQKSLSFAPTVSVQHTHLIAMGEDCQTMPLDYASYQINLGQFEEAVETLEQGRALLWSEMRGLRTPVAQLVEDSPLVKRFAEINQELEALTVSVTPSGRPEIEDGVAQGRDGTDPFGRLVIERKKLVEERDALIVQIQSQPGLEGFLRAPPFTTLRSAASRGPVIIINHCEWRSDIIIIFHNSLPCSLPTAKNFYVRANKLRDELVEARERGLDSREYQDALCSVLKGLYEIVGEPVINRLRELGVPEQSRIWWCPTSVFCSLPLHAMGPIPPNDTCEPASKRYFSDLYIPSYTPSLSALVESRKVGLQTLERPSLLLVAQPEDSLPGVNGEIRVIERALKTRIEVTGLISSEATPSSVLEGLRRSQFAHFACHGALETGKPFEASFKLHGGSRLTLLDLARSRLPDAEFAFLSCCHAAEITEESVADEALHLTAAMQYCGFRTVVGTMWEMADTDGRDLAKNFYKSLFSSQDSSIQYHERSAGALRNAVRKLRCKRGISLERWVNFVHYGA